MGNTSLVIYRVLVHRPSSSYYMHAVYGESVRWLPLVVNQRDGSDPPIHPPIVSD